MIAPMSMFAQLLFEDVSRVVLNKARSLGRDQKKKFKFKNPLYSIDSSVIDLCLEVFDRALYKRTKGAVKPHLMLEHQSYLPCCVLISDGKTADVTVARKTSLPRGVVVAMDRGCVDFNLFSSWTAQGVYFVTRILNILGNRDLPAWLENPKELPLMPSPDQSPCSTSKES